MRNKSCSEWAKLDKKFSSESQNCIQLTLSRIRDETIFETTYWSTEQQNSNTRIYAHRESSNTKNELCKKSVKIKLKTTFESFFFGLFIINY